MDRSNNSKEELIREIENLEKKLNELQHINESEKNLEESEFRFRLLAENSTDMIARHDKAGKFLYVSPACKNLLGYEPEELIGHSVFEFVHPDDQKKIEDSRKDVVDNTATTTKTYRIKCKDGHYIWFETISKSIKDAQTGKITEIHASSRDITGRKISEKKLRTSEQNLSMLFSAMTEMVAMHELVFNEKGEVINYKIIDCNKAYSAITGIKKEDAVGNLATDVYQTETPPYLIEFSKVALTGEAYDYTIYFPPMDKHFMITVVSPEKNKFATITTDITAIQQIQESITEKNKELENYLYVASHDLRSPLVNIQGFGKRLEKQIQMISETVDNCSIENEDKNSLEKITKKDIPQSLHFIFSNVSKMDTLINGLLQISRTGRLKMTITKINVNELIQNIISAYNFQITEIGTQVNIGDLPECYGDLNQLNQLFSNILSNALKYHDPNKKLFIDISGRISYNKVIYSVKDSGLGISERHIQRIWDVFYRINPASNIEGEGLGLSIAKRIIDKHKGKIWLKSEEGVGTTFYIELQRHEFSE